MSFRRALCLVLTAAAAFVFCACGAGSGSAADAVDEFGECDYAPFPDFEEPPVTPSPTPAPDEPADFPAVTEVEDGIGEDAAPVLQMTETPDSSCFREIGYDGESLLAVRFRDSGSLYYYYDFPPDEWEAFLSAESLGRYYNAYISGGSYACERIE